MTEAYTFFTALQAPKLTKAIKYDNYINGFYSQTRQIPEKCINYC